MSELPVAALVLAAGDSSRMGTPKALLRHGDGRTFLRAACEALLAAGCAPVLALLGRQHLLLEGEVPQGARPLINPAPERGQVSSLALGLAAAAEQGAGAALVALVDQPVLAAPLLARLREAAVHEPGAVHVPLSGGKRGHPCVFPVALAAALQGAGPSEGARDVIARIAVPVREHAVDDPSVLLDLDTPEELQRWRKTR